jgi:DNA helicase-2/ATP-dependent DNA helicase PcrA
VALYTNLDYQKESDAVKIMTIHQAKGLEFPVVFVAGMSEGIFPSERTIRERKRNGLEEERRLAYVAYTRAEEGLYITESEGYNFESKSNKYPSRFIFEIKKNLLVRQGHLSRELEESAKSYISCSEKSITLGEQSGTFTKGATVTHKLFGKGTVIEINEKEQSIVVDFNHSLTKHFSLERAASVLTIVE